MYMGVQCKKIPNCTGLQKWKKRMEKRTFEHTFHQKMWVLLADNPTLDKEEALNQILPETLSEREREHFLYSIREYASLGCEHASEEWFQFMEAPVVPRPIHPVMCFYCPFAVKREKPCLHWIHVDTSNCFDGLYNQWRACTHIYAELDDLLASPYKLVWDVPKMRMQLETTIHNIALKIAEFPIKEGVICR